MSIEHPEEGRARTPLDILLEVQDLDTAITQLAHRKATLEERQKLATVLETLADVERRRAVADSSRADLARRQAEFETQIAATASRHAAIEQRLYAARGAAARDLQAMNEEIAHLAERRSELEDEELEVMVELEPVDAELAALAAEHARLADSEAALRAALTASEGAIDAELAQRVEARTSLARTLPEELRRRYDALRARLGGTGAARLVGNRCSGCHLELPSMEVERIRHLPPGVIVTCEQCGRILVPVSASAPATPAGETSPRPSR